MRHHPPARAVSAPPDPGCAMLLPGHQFADAYRVPVPPGMDAMAATRLAFARGPWWVRGLMALRNGVVGVFGLKAASSAGFPVISQSPERVVLGFDDRHLDFRIVVALAGGCATLTTAVRWHNAFGRAYLAVVMPFHRVIAARMLEGVAGVPAA
ncbi:MAG TPA: DUF2867 domain-containing protein [Burkholderiaceae bacterium]